MAIVSIGQPGRGGAVGSDVCVKCGRETTDRVVLQGSTSPRWVGPILIFSVIAWLIVSDNTQRRYSIEVPFCHGRNNRYLGIRRLAWCTGVAGLVATFVGFFVHAPHAGWLLAIAGAALLGGVANALVNNVGVREGRVDELVLTRVHPAAARAITAARSGRC